MKIACLLVLLSLGATAAEFSCGTFVRKQSALRVNLGDLEGIRVIPANEEVHDIILEQSINSTGTACVKGTGITNGLLTYALELSAD